ncbi:MAG: hypothetical protein HYY23_09790 [Verrucomicrobia bacterium]|nr:hypothetical protein [Verrucomicrobiota bacterium]
MRLVVVMAGGFGFLTVVLGSMAWNKPIEMSLVNGAISAFVAGILLRWWMKLWITSLEQVSRQEEMAATLDQLEADAEQARTASKLSESGKP